MTGNVMEALLTLMLSDRLGADVNAQSSPGIRQRMPCASGFRTTLDDPDQADKHHDACGSTIDE